MKLRSNTHARSERKSRTDPFEQMSTIASDQGDRSNGRGILRDKDPSTRCEPNDMPKNLKTSRSNFEIHETRRNTQRASHNRRSLTHGSHTFRNILEISRERRHLPYAPIKIRDDSGVTESSVWPAGRKPGNSASLAKSEISGSMMLLGIECESIDTDKLIGVASEIEWSWRQTRYDASCAPMKKWTELGPLFGGELNSIWSYRWRIKINLISIRLFLTFFQAGGKKINGRSNW
jgi:hypothetical protein